MRIGPHAHACQHCRTPVECCGEIVQNYDGFPEFTCREYHLEGGSVAFFLCDACAQASDDAATTVQEGAV